MNQPPSIFPQITVIMPVYNAESYLREAIESVLNQTFTNFVFIILDDGSTDTSKSIIEKFTAGDSRIIPFYLEQNQGYVKCLNFALEKITTKYIARIDSDDVCLPSRFQRQFEYLEKKPEIGVLGSASININPNGEILNTHHVKTTSQAIRWISFFKNPLLHPSVMVRTAALSKVGNYNESMMPAEDYDLWSRMLSVTEIENIAEPLIKYRVHENSISRTKSELQKTKTLEILKNYWKQELDIELNTEDALFLKHFQFNEELTNLNRCAPIYQFVSKAHQHIKKKSNNRLDQEAKSEIFKILWYLTLKSREHAILLFIRLFLKLFFKFPSNIIIFIINHKTGIY
jgi:glycosyltransferase involved in cell wall biosynthesis